MPDSASGLAWIAHDRQTYCSRARTIKACRVDKLAATVVTWQSELYSPRTRADSVMLSGSHYFGLGMRFVRSMDGGEFFNADGKEGTIFRGEERLVRSNWCAYTAAIDGKPVTVAMFGHPDNPRHPTTWFTMAKPFAYLSATMNLHEEPLPRCRKTAGVAVRGRRMGRQGGQGSHRSRHIAGSQASIRRRRRVYRVRRRCDPNK